MNPPPLEIQSNRQVRKWSRRELIGRVAWGAVRPLFRWSPKIFWGWRRWLLRSFGAEVGQDVRIDPTARVFIPWNLSIGDWSAVGAMAELYNLGHLRIGTQVTISQRAHLCGGTHDLSSADLPLVKATIEIGSGAWICADAFVGPGVCIGSMAIVGARAVAMKDVDEHAIVAGNPATIIGRRHSVPTD